MWSASSLPGFNNSGNRLRTAATATATWAPTGLTPGNYRVEFYKVVRGSI